MNSIAGTFDAAAQDYAGQLNRGISLSGESADYFVSGRVAWLARACSQRQLHNATPRPKVLDFGCGVGNACQSLLSELNATEVIGLDCSAESLRLAASRHSTSTFKWTTDGANIPTSSIDVVYTSGVFHHIEPKERQGELCKIFQWLKPGGLFALFENNPWNPGTRWVMSRIPFDRDAVCLSPCESRKRLTDAGFTLLQTRSLFYFPSALRIFRPFEGPLSLVPLGAQYVVLAQRPI